MDRRRTRNLLTCAVMLALAISAATAQVELLPIDHPATRALTRLYEYGAIPEFPREHLPISRRLALQLLDEAAADIGLPESMREIARYYGRELGADIGRTPTAVVIKTTDQSQSVFDRPFDGLPLAFLEYRDTTHGLHLAFEPLFDGEVRSAPDDDLTAIVVQGGAQLRGTILDRVGFTARITNGTVVGDSDLVLRDPRFGRSAKFGVARQNRDADFGSGHVRVDFDAVSVEIGRERLQLGGGLEQTLLLGSELPSNFDYLRLGARLGRVSFSHVHASLLAEPLGSTQFGPETNIPSKYIAAHLVTFGPFGGLRGSLGEAVIYTGRPFEVGYLNPFNFMKSQEHYLRDRDNSFMYAALSVNPTDGLVLEGEFLLDDLKFSEIGKGYFGNKSASRISAQLVGLPLAPLDLGVSYTRVEPYTYSHTNPSDGYLHDGAPLAAGGLEPNSYLIEARATLVPLPNLWVRAVIGIGEHGANVAADTGLVRNVGGDIRMGRRGEIDALTVTFLDGTLEKLTRLRLDVDYEPLRHVYLRLTALRNSVERDGRRVDETELRLGARVGVR